MKNPQVLTTHPEGVLTTGPEPTTPKSHRLTEFKTAAAAALLALSIGTSSLTSAQTPDQPSVSATAPADKGLGQVVQLKDGTIMSFSDIAKLPKEKKDEVIDNQMTDAQFQQWELFQKGQIQAANHTEKVIDGNINAANQQGQQIDKQNEQKKDALNKEKTGLEKDQTALNQTVGKRGEVNEALNQEKTGLEKDQTALNQARELNTVLDELFAEQKGLVIITPDIHKKNQERGRKILGAIDNPLVIEGMDPKLVKTLRTMGESLMRSGNVILMSKVLTEEVKKQTKK